MPEMGPWQVNPSRPEEFESLVNEIVRKENGRLPKVIYLWALDALISDASPDPDLEKVYAPIYGGALHLSQALIKLSPARTKDHTVSLQELWLVTRGAQAINPSHGEVAVFQAPLWGFGRTLSREYPDFRIVCLDLDPTDAQNSAHQLLQETRKLSSEKQVAYRDNRRLVARLERSHAKLKTDVPLKIDDQGQYLITGGLGGLGLTVARWLVNKGARHLTLMSRSAITSEARSTLDELALLGAEISVVQGDVADSKDVLAVLQKIERFGKSAQGNYPRCRDIRGRVSYLPKHGQGLGWRLNPKLTVPGICISIQKISILISLCYFRQGLLCWDQPDRVTMPRQIPS